MKSGYLVWSAKRVEGACVLTPLSGVERRFELTEGVPRASDFPPDASFAMSPEFPDNMLLTDNLINVDMLQVVSPRLKAVFERRSADALEVLPVTVLDHRGRAVDPGYFILNPLRPVDCLDIDRCGARRSRIVKSIINEVQRLVLDESRIPPDRLLFRPLGFPRVTLVRRDVAEEIDREGMTGVRWIEPSEYPEI